jgi:phosphatidylserine decarboxylase
VTPHWSDRLKAGLQYLLPKQLLTALAWGLSTIKVRWFRMALMRGFCKLFPVNLAEAESDQLADYRHFNAFFTRALKPDARPLDPSATLISPCDGTLSELGAIRGDRLIQAKGIDYGVAELLGSGPLAREFVDGQFMTIYLAPYDYHRVHVPAAGRLVFEQHLPGELFSVSAATTRVIPRLFARNERLVAMFESERGHYAVIMVAALMVAGIETVWSGPRRRPNQATPLFDDIHLARGAEMGRFHWGSTVIVLTPPGWPNWKPDLTPGRVMRLGEALTD